MDIFTIFSTVLLVAISIACVLANALVFACIYYEKRMQTKQNAFVLCLASADFLVAVFNIPLTIVSSLKGGWSSGLCRVLGFFEMLFLVVSVMSLGLISLNRYFFVVYWNTYHQIFTWRRVIFLIFALWSLSVALCLPPLIGWSRYGYKAGKGHCFVLWSSDAYYTYFMAITCFLGPIIAMLCSYYKIFKYQRRADLKLKLNLGMSLSSENNPEFSRSAGKLEHMFTTSRPQVTSCSRSQVTSEARENIIKDTDVSKLDCCKILDEMNADKSVSRPLTKSDSYQKAVSCSIAANRDTLSSNLQVTADCRGSRNENSSKYSGSDLIDGSDPVRRIMLGSCQNSFESNRTADGFGSDSIAGSLDNECCLTAMNRSRVAWKGEIAEKHNPEDKTIQNYKGSDFTSDCSTTFFDISGVDTKKSFDPQEKYTENMSVINDKLTVRESKYAAMRLCKVNNQVVNDECLGTSDFDDSRTTSETNDTKTHSAFRVLLFEKMPLSKEERAITRMSVIMASAFFLSWLLFTVLMFIEFYKSVVVNAYIDKLALILGYLNSVYNPIIYGFMNRRFRNAYKNLWVRICRRRN